MNFLLLIHASSCRADSLNRQMAVVVCKSGSGKIANGLVRVCLSQIPDIILVTIGLSIYALQRLASLASVLTAIKKEIERLTNSFFSLFKCNTIEEDVSLTSYVVASFF